MDSATVAAARSPTAGDLAVSAGVTGSVPRKGGRELVAGGGAAVDALALVDAALTAAGSAATAVAITPAAAVPLFATGEATLLSSDFFPLKVD